MPVTKERLARLRKKASEARWYKLQVIPARFSEDVYGWERLVARKGQLCWLVNPKTENKEAHPEGLWYVIFIYEGEPRCTCPAGNWSKDCVHIGAWYAKQVELQEMYGEPRTSI